MNDLSTNAIIAALRAISTEIHAREQNLEHESLSDDSAEELGYYVGDLHEALAGITALYNLRRENDPELASPEALLRSFG